MRYRSSLIVAALASAFLGYAARSTQPAGGPSKEDVLAQMEKGAALATEHDLLAKFAGTFQSTGKAMVSADLWLDWRGTERARTILGGRFLEIDFDADAGQKPDVHSKTILGYDTRVKKYTLWSIDTLGTYSVGALGDFDKAKQELTLLGSVQEAQQVIQFKFIFKLDGNASHTQEMWMELPGQGWTKMTESRSVPK